MSFFINIIYLVSFTRVSEDDRGAPSLLLLAEKKKKGCESPTTTPDGPTYP